MTTSDLRDLLAIANLTKGATVDVAYRHADLLLPNLLAARETRWARYREGKAVAIFDTFEEAKKHWGLGSVVLPYKEPKP